MTFFTTLMGKSPILVNAATRSMTANSTKRGITRSFAVLANTREPTIKPAFTDWSTRWTLSHCSTGLNNQTRHLSSFTIQPFSKVMGFPPTFTIPSLPLVHIQNRTMASKKHKRIVKLAKGYRGRGNRCYRIAIRRVEKAWQYAYRDRKQKKRDFRRLWIQRINAGTRQHGLGYAAFINQLNQSPVVLNRKVLANLASQEPFSFKSVVDVVRQVHVS